jgi:dynein heavy chain
VSQAEDPAVFAHRLSAAHASRRQFESYIRYSLYVDSMPIDEMQPLDNEQTARILASALNSKSLKSNALDTAPLLNEVNIDYARTMNKIIFDMNLKDPSHAALRATLAALPPPETKKRKTRGTISTVETASDSALPAASSVAASSQASFQKTFSEFCFQAFITKPEIVNALIKVNSECIRILKLGLFNTLIPKVFHLSMMTLHQLEQVAVLCFSLFFLWFTCSHQSVRLDEFEQLQNSAMGQTHHILTDAWVTALKNCVKTALRDVGKGWFNLQERSRYVSPP